MIPFENIPDDLVPLTAYFKNLLTYATPHQPLCFFLDSIDQLTGTADKVSWLPTRMPPNCKVYISIITDFFFDVFWENNIYRFQIIMSCANEVANPTVSKEYHMLRRLIDIDENFIEVEELGEDLAMNVLQTMYSFSMEQ